MNALVFFGGLAVAACLVAWLLDAYPKVRITKTPSATDRAIAAQYAEEARRFQRMQDEAEGQRHLDVLLHEYAPRSFKEPAAKGFQRRAS